ncbi:MAG: hypothetical protein ACXWUS_16550 [Burkholderiales bacterium]
MKHGDKTKGKASKASGKKASQSGKSTGKAASSKSKSVPEKVSVKTSTKTSAKTSTKTSIKAAGKPKVGNGAGVGAPRPAGDGFSNPIVGAAFKHAVKKYPNAFRKLTD